MNKINTRTLYWDAGKLKILDQRLLPGRVKYISCREPAAVWEAIKTLRVRGAPAIGDAAAYGIVLGALRSAAANSAALIKDVEKTARYLKTSRPTAVNLFWALDRMTDKARSLRGDAPDEIRRKLLQEADAVCREDEETCARLSQHGAELLKDGDKVITYCNAGALATAGMGTALGVIYAAALQKKKIKVYACETRPLLQGARLTSWELTKNKIDATLICDNTAGWTMKQGAVDAVLVGADRIAPNGDSANKIGSYALAVLAKHHRIPFYVCAPFSTFDFSIKTGDEIPIEERSGDEVKKIAGVSTAPRAVKTYSPAFDVIPAKLISGIVTEKGVIRPPFRRNIVKTHET